MDWSQTATVLGVCATAGTIVVKLTSAWTKKAIAEAEATKELKELRESHSKFMARMQEVEDWKKRVEIRDEERIKARRDTKGIVTEEQ